MRKILVIIQLLIQKISLVLKIFLEKFIHIIGNQFVIIVNLPLIHFQGVAEGSFRGGRKLSPKPSRLRAK